MSPHALDTVPVAILAGGAATRLGALAAHTPKALIDINGEPFVAHQLRLLRARGFRRVVLCIGHLGAQIEAVVGTGSAFDLDVKYSHDGGEPRGTAGALRHATALLGEVFWVVYGDSYLDFHYAAAQAEFDVSGALGLMTVLRNDNRWDRSNVAFDSGRLQQYDKRHQTSAMHHIDFGAAILSRAALARIHDEGAADLADLYSSLVSEGAMIGHEVTERFYEVGSPAGLEDTRRHLSNRNTPR